MATVFVYRCLTKQKNGLFDIQLSEVIRLVINQRYICWSINALPFDGLFFECFQRSYRNAY